MTLIFNKEAHTYHLDGKELKSVSKWIEQFVPKFDSEAVSMACAKRDNLNQQDILDKWEKKKNISVHLGNWVHESIEYYLKYDKDFTNAPVEAFKKHQTQNRYLSETIVHNDEIAGTIDLIEVIEKGKVKIHDFKTNEDLYKKKGKLLGEYKHLENSPVNKYTLQLNKYKELLQGMKDVEVLELNLWHYKDGEFKIIKLDIL